jgi:hypothetical protein
LQQLGEQQLGELVDRGAGVDADPRQRPRLSGQPGGGAGHPEAGVVVSARHRLDDRVAAERIGNRQRSRLPLLRESRVALLNSRLMRLKQS